jgi:predicted MFS family arabinose efflux permease
VTPVRGLRSGLVFAGVALIATCYGFARFAYGLFAPRLSEEFALSGTLAGVIGGGGYVGYCLAIGVSTVLTTRWGPRRVAVLAGAIATVGIGIVAIAPSAPVLAVGVLVAGSSTGVASPPLAAAVACWVEAGVRDTAQTVVNAGTGIGVLISGPVALILLDQWRWAWALFAVITAAVTVWVAVALPAGRPADAAADATGEDDQPKVTRGTGTLVVASFALGLASIAVWTFGQEIVSASSRQGWLAPVVWTVIGAAGIGGAFSGPVVARLGVKTSWTVLMVMLAAGIAGLAAGASTPLVAVLAGAVFGAAYIALTGVLLVWATRVYPTRTAFGVGLAFFTIAVGQAVGAPLVGFGSEAFALPVVFYACALVALAGAWVPRLRATRTGADLA